MHSRCCTPQQHASCELKAEKLDCARTQKPPSHQTRSPWLRSAMLLVIPNDASALWCFLRNYVVPLPPNSFEY